MLPAALVSTLCRTQYQLCIRTVTTVRLSLPLPLHRKVFPLTVSLLCEEINQIFYGIVIAFLKTISINERFIVVGQQ